MFVPSWSVHSLLAVEQSTSCSALLSLGHCHSLLPCRQAARSTYHISYQTKILWMDTAWKCRTWSNALILNAIAQQKHSLSFASFHSQTLAGWKQENDRTCFINEKPCRVRLPGKALSSELRIIDSPLAALIQCWAYSIAKNAIPISSHLYPTDSHSSEQRITSHKHWEEGFWKATACFSATSAISCSVILV